LTLLLHNEHCESIDEGTLVEKLIALETHAIDWERKVDSGHPDEEALVIDDLHTNLMNQSNGFGDRNNKALYEEMISTDSSGVIKEATVGMKLSKKN
jgi:hypothetical protein